MHVHVSKQKRACTHQIVLTGIYALCAHVFTRNFSKIVLIVQNYAMALSLINNNKYIGLIIDFDFLYLHSYAPPKSSKVNN